MKLQLMIVISSLKGKYSHFKNWYILFLWFRTVQKSQWTWKILERLQRQWIMKDFLAETESTQRNVLIIWGHFLFQNWEHYNRIKLIWISNRKQTFCGSTKSVSYSLSVEQLQILYPMTSQVWDLLLCFLTLTKSSSCSPILTEVFKAVEITYWNS